MYVINRIYLLFTIREIRPHTTTYNHHIVRISKLRVDTRLYVNRKKMNWFIQLEESAVTPTTLLQAFTFTTTTKTDTFVKGQDTTHTHKVRITYFTYFSHLYLTYISISSISQDVVSTDTQHDSTSLRLEQHAKVRPCRSSTATD